MNINISQLCLNLSGFDNVWVKSYFSKDNQTLEINIDIVNI